MTMETTTLLLLGLALIGLAVGAAALPATVQTSVDAPVAGGSAAVCIPSPTGHCLWVCPSKLGPCVH